MNSPLVFAGLALCLASPAYLAAQVQTLAPAPVPDSTSVPQDPPPVQEQAPPPPPTQNPPTRSANNHAEIGAFADYFRFDPSGLSNAANFVGVGGRVGVNVHPNIALEGEMSYDFARNFTTVSSSGGTTTFVTSGVRPLTGLFGPKFQFGTSGPFRVFATGKVGFIDFSVNNSGAVSGSTFTGAVAGVGNSGTHVAFYPGGGVEMFAGWFGLRFEAGDEIYLNNGTYNNLRVTAGPVIRF